MGALDGVKVVEMGIFVAGPACAAVLADWGADVIKVENPDGGDPIRALVSLGLVPFELPINPALELDNRNKRSVTIDIQKPDGRELVLKLIEKADVFVSNFRPAALARAGLSYADMTAVNPRIIYAGLSGYGTRGPDKDRAAFDYAAFWSRSGAMASLAEPGRPPPTQRPAMGDHPAGLALAGAVSAALYSREKTGRGQELHLSLFQSGLWMMASDIEVALVTGAAFVPSGRTVPNPLWNHYRAKDDRWFHLVMLQADRFWARFCAAIERPELAAEPRYKTIRDRAKASAELIAIFDEHFATRTRNEWAIAFDREELIWAPIQSIAEVAADPQAEALGAYESVAHRSGQEVRYVRSPIDFSATPATIRHGAPELGEHTEEVLLELGLEWAEIGRLREGGVLG